MRVEVNKFDTLTKAINAPLLLGDLVMIVTDDIYQYGVIDYYKPLDEWNHPTANGLAIRWLRASDVIETEKNWTVDYNGTGFVRIPDMILEAGDILEFDFVWNGNSQQYMYLIDSSPTNDGIIQFKPDSLTLRKMDATINGVELGSGNTFTFEPDKLYTFKLTVTEAFTLATIGGRNRTDVDMSVFGTTTNIKLPNRFYKSLYPTKPTDLYLKDELNEFRPNDWTVDYNDKGYVSIPEIVFNGQFAIEVTGTANRDQFYFGKVGGLELYIGNAIPTINLYWGSNTVTFSPVPPTLEIGRVYTFRLEKREDNHIYITYDGNTYKSAAPQLGSKGFDTVGARLGYAGRFVGNIYDLKLTDLSNPSNSRNYPSIIQSDTQPNTLELVDTINGENGTLTNFDVGQEWANSLTTDGTLTNFPTGSEWIEIDTPSPPPIHLFNN